MTNPTPEGINEAPKIIVPMNPEEEIKQTARDIVQVVVANWPEYNLMTGRERNNLFDGIKPILHHQLQKAREETEKQLKEELRELYLDKNYNIYTLGAWLCIVEDTELDQDKI